MPDTFQQMLKAIQSFLIEEIYPLEEQLEAPFFSRLEPLLQEKRRIVKTKGWWCPQMPESYGGMGLNLIQLAQLSEILGTTPLGHYVFNCQAPDAGNMELLLEHGSEWQRTTFLEPLIAGKIRSCFSMTEPQNAGSNPTLMSTRAQLDNEWYTINGHKWFTSSADGASFAIVMALSQPDHPNPYQRASLFLVSTSNQGFEHKRNIPVMGSAGSGYISHAEIIYKNCKVPIAHRIGGDGAGFQLAQQRLGPGRIHHCMRWIGICERALDLMCRRAASRMLKTDKKLGDMQTIQNWIAESRVSIDACRLLVLDTAAKIESEGAKAAKVAISSIKFYVAGVMSQILDRAIQTHGALGVTDDLVLSFWYRHERGARIYDGPDEVHKSVLARNILKKYKDIAAS
jgi:alkylation response protein AidB-like acyl-CoA dehydrogenase